MSYESERAIDRAREANDRRQYEQRPIECAEDIEDRIREINRQIEDEIEALPEVDAIRGKYFDELHHLRNRTTIRASSLPLMAKCPASFRECEGLPNISCEAALDGTLKHAVRAAVGNDTLDADALAREHGVDVETINDLAHRYRWAKEVGEGWTAHWEREFEMKVTQGLCKPPVKITGHPDLVLTNAETDHTIDFKEGRLDVDPVERNPQLIAYLLMVSGEFGGKISIFYGRTRGLESKEFGPEDMPKLLAWIEDIVVAARSDNPEYRPGAHCSLCPARNKCKAWHPMVPVLMGPIQAVDVSGMTDEQLGVAIAGWKAMQKIMGDLEMQAKERAAIRPIPLPGGNEYFAPVETPGNREIDAERAWPILTQYLGGRMPDAIKVMTGAMEAAAVAHYEDSGGDRKKGYKGAVKGRLWDAMKTAGAVTQEPKTVFKIVAKEKLLESKGDKREQSK